ncbi:MAG: phosphoribosylaminoimidazolesuccinocarboxamide synthase [Trueperaceae bacterium]|nr:phosphoribosylaminoimidazolesuccinocarboxamide synthase [Trueperaceae bacterium]
MIDEATLYDVLPQALDTFDMPELGTPFKGKVRDLYRVTRHKRHKLVLITTDRLSAFDRVLGLVPYKGQILNELSAFWFRHCEDIVGNHLIATPDPNITVARVATPLPVEVVVRGYLTGVTKTSLWYRYDTLGERTIYGYELPDGLEKDQPLPEPLLTPTTKGGPTGHDERLTVDEVTERGLVKPALWQQIQDVALALFRRGQEVAAQQGLVLVDTKYEFGTLENGGLVLIDEIHTPDSSRYWRADSLQSGTPVHLDPVHLDKEFVRLAYADEGYRGDGPPPPLSPDLAVQTSLRYQELFETLTGRNFGGATYPAEPRIRQVLMARYLDGL